MRHHDLFRWISAICLAFAPESFGQFTQDEPIVAGQAATTSSPVRVSGYVDVGFSRAENNGRGFIFDTSGTFSSQFPKVAWVLLGDPWSTAINSRGEPADTGGSLAFTHNPVASNGAATFLINEVNLDFSATPVSSIFAFASVDFLPRTGLRGTLGDFFDLDYAYVDWTPFDELDLTFSVGKFDSVFGREYRLGDAPDRPGIVPSLLFRYVGGHPLGIKARGKFLGQRLVIAAAILDGSSFIETMSFADDVDRNDMKTGSGRVSFDVPLPIWNAHVDLGLSGEVGAQGRQTDSTIIHWQWGFDAFLECKRLELRGEFVRGIAPGGGLEEADALNYRSFFIEGFFRILPALGVLARYEERHAVHRRAEEFVYLVEIARAVVGIRFDPVSSVALKLEYIVNFELSPLPSFPNDVFTSSLVVSF